MKEKKEISISVREIIEFIMRKGDLSPISISPARAVDGTRAHQWVQKNAGDHYTAEVPISRCHEMEKYNLKVSGRIDGIILDEEAVIIDEIKSTTRDLMDIEEEDYPMHWAQAEMYAFMYCIENKLPHIKVRLTYITIDTYEMKHFEKTYPIEQLKEKYDEIIEAYIRWANLFYEWEIDKYASIKALEFPFQNYRMGQKTLLSSSYKTVIQNNKLFVRAPTGIGKTISTIFASVKALEKKLDAKKIFYLTAKTIGREVAEKTFNILLEEGLLFKVITLTAKEKICLMEHVDCDGQYCPYAKGHYDRVNDVIYKMLVTHHHFTRELIVEYASSNNVCPFELSLDLALFSDAVICDYNYAFDPRAMLKRFFLEHNHFIFLVDEAHNLVDRAREMYSSTIEKQEVLAIKKIVKGLDRQLTKYLNQLNQEMLSYLKLKDSKDTYYLTEKECPEEMISLARGILHRIEHLLEQNRNFEDKDSLMNFFFSLHDFVKKSEFFDEHYVTFYTCQEHNVKVKLYCLDPSRLLAQAFEKAKASIVFSATLIPLEYYVKVLGGSKENFGSILPSPFKQEHLCLMIHNKISTKYKDREKTYGHIAETIYEAIHLAQGNYLVFFPSYQYMEIVSALIEEKFDHTIKVLKQTAHMKEEEREAFLAAFHPENNKTLVGFAVLGGIFGEGIDLVGERLKGVIIVGVGLPGISYERDLIKAHYKGSYEGFKYAYMYPGMNKVLQAVGRVIRTETDRGMVLLIDERFGHQNYQQLFPSEWSHAKYVQTIEQIKTILSNFWRQDDI